jgi:hypothetical protein
MTESHVLEFAPHNTQFVLYDAQTIFDPEDQPPLWTEPDEADQPISVRRFEMAVGLLDDASVRLELTYSSTKPNPIKGSWEVRAQAMLEVPSGRFGVGDVIANQAELVIEVPAGKLHVRVFGRLDHPGQTFIVQVWPA